MMEKREVSLQKFAEQLRETEFQENRWLRDEVRELKQFIWMLIESSGGEIRIPYTVKMGIRAEDCRFSVSEDSDNRVTVVRSGDVFGDTANSWPAAGDVSP